MAAQPAASCHHSGKRPLARMFPSHPCRLAAAHLLLAGFLCAVPQSKAACLYGDLSVDGNNCTGFDPATPSTATLRFEDAKLNDSVSPARAGAKYFQLKIFTARSSGTAGSYTISDFGWSRTADGPYTTFQNILTVGPTPTATSIASTAVSSPPALGSPFFFRYTLPAGVNDGDIFDVSFQANNDQAVDGSGYLATSVGNSYLQLGRDNQALVPGPLPLAGALAALGYSRRIRRALHPRAPK